ncbi:MAG: hypothetical protein HYW37_02145 [Candidatus Colwellbacteria bacterium]|nr:hypothetical protein [Candidatus Colwellbacteria bacterium]
MEYWQRIGKNKTKKIPSVDILFKKGLRHNAYLRGVGWKHAGLTSLARRYGFKKSKSYDLAGRKTDEAVKVLKRFLKLSPLIVSVFSGYKPKGGGHLPLLISLTSQKAKLIDPAGKNRKSIIKILPSAKFLRAWKKRFIAIKP